MNAPLSAPKADFTVLAKTYIGNRLNSPNDATFHKNGDLYFTDPPYGLTRKMEDPNKGLQFQGVYRARSRNRRTIRQPRQRERSRCAATPANRWIRLGPSGAELRDWRVPGEGSTDCSRTVGLFKTKAAHLVFAKAEVMA